jgi:CRISPR-associated endonuclease/helicase Cas3
MHTFWGKARPHALGPQELGPQETGPEYHSVLAHSLDVAAVAVLLGASGEALLPGRTLGFLVALHDIGKFSRPFQAMVPAHWPAAALGDMPADPPRAPRHDAVGLYLLRGAAAPALDGVLTPRAGGVGWAADERNHLLQALAGHHGRPVDEDQVAYAGRASVLCDACLAAARAFAGAMADLFRPALLPAPRGGAARLGWGLAGLVTLADWVGSRQDWFPYTEASDPAAYFWDHALPRAAAALAAAGLASAPAARFDGMRHLFAGLSRPSPVQDWAETAALPPGSVLAVIEDVTGSGKTEAAITLAHRLLASGRANGVFLALPTMATANAMFGRMADAYHRLFRPDARPSLVLAHGRAGMDARFTALMGGGAMPGASPADPADMPAEAHCAAWLAEDRRRALLAQFGVGTIDQALLAVLPVRHAALRLAGLRGKVLIVDEAHAFDPYMRRELLELLRFHAGLGGSAILLSATLPLAVRQKLVDAFRGGLGKRPLPLVSQAYPLATLVSADGAAEHPCDMRAGLTRQVAVTRLDDAAAALVRIVAAVRAGAAVAWIRNTVDDAIAAAEALRAAGLAPLLFHARFAMADRLGIEAEVLRRFGRDSAGEARRAVLVATQVIEQSLDLDFDVLCTDMAPADLLIQRAGRLWRHARGARQVDRAELLVVCPAPVDDPAADWIRASQPGTAAVYRDPALLWRSARAVFAAGCIATPEGMRPLVEGAAEGEVPAGLAAQANVADGRGKAQGAQARQNTLRWEEGYCRQNGAWEPETHTPTRLEDRPTVTLRLAVLRDGKVVPYVRSPESAYAAQDWALSEVSVSRGRVAACPVPPGLEAGAELARSGWGRWERDSPRLLLAVMVPDGDSYAIDAVTQAGVAQKAAYDRGIGLILPTGRSLERPGWQAPWSEEAKSCHETTKKISGGWSDPLG